MARLALLFSGQVRQIDPVLFRNGLKILVGNNQADIYLCRWENAGISGNHDKTALTSSVVIDIDIKTYLAQAFQGFTIKEHTVVSEAEWENAKTEAISNIISDERFDVRTINSARQIFQIYCSYKLVINPNEYDFIVRCRFDSIFVFPFAESSAIVDKCVGSINFGAAFYGRRIYDIFFYCQGFYSSDLFCSWLNFVELVNDPFDNGLDRRDACRLLYVASRRAGMKVTSSRLRYCDTYRNEVAYFFNLFRWGLEDSRIPSIGTLGMYVLALLKLLFRRT